MRNSAAPPFVSFGTSPPLAHLREPCYLPLDAQSKPFPPARCHSLSFSRAPPRYVRQRLRPPAGHGRAPRSQDALLGPDAWLRDRQLDRVLHRRRAPRRGGLALSRPVPHEPQRVDQGALGDLRAQPPRQVLPPHRGRPPASPRTDLRVAAPRRRRQSGRKLQGGPELGEVRKSS